MYPNHYRCLLCFLFMVTAGVAFADDSEDDSGWNQWSASGMAHHFEPDDDRFDLEDGSGLRFGLGHPITDALTAEVAVLGNSIDRGNRSGQDWQYSLGVDALYKLHDGFVTPYLIAGGGGMFNDFATGTDTGPYANAGLGVKVPIWGERVSLRAEARYAADWADDSGGGARFDDSRFFIGIEIPLFGKPERPEPRTEIKTETKVVERERVVKEIPDMQPLDGVTFKFDSATLTPNARTVLQRIVRDLEYHSDVTVQIRGHTDSIGSAEYNEELSKARAESVKDFLVSEGIDEDRITTKGFGYRKPRATNDTEEGRRLNRRIEMKRTDEEASQ